MVSICPLLWQRDVKLQQTNELLLIDIIRAHWWGRYIYNNHDNTDNTKPIFLEIAQTKKIWLFCHKKSFRNTEKILPIWPPDS